MKLADMLKQSQQSLAEFWVARDGRERKMLAAAATVIAFALAYWVLIDPALSGRQRLNKSLPTLRGQVAELQLLAKEAAALSGKTASAATTISKETIEAALLRKGLKPQNLTLSGGQVQLRLAAASFSSTLSWLEEMQKSSLLSVTEANIVALPQPDTVDAILTLRQPSNE